jgi:hypothetical protein
MPIRLIPKRNAAPRVAPLPEELEEGELALNTYDGALYSKLVGGEVRRLNGDAGDTSLEDRVEDLEARLNSLVGTGGLLESGTWTPQIIALGGTVSQPSVTYDSRQGVYSRFGPTVVANGRVRFTSTGGAGTALAVTGLPFDHAVTREGNAVVKVRGAGTIGFAGGASAVKPLTLWGAGGTSMWLGKYVDGTGDESSVAYFAPGDATGVIDIVFTYTYQTTYGA